MRTMFEIGFRASEPWAPAAAFAGPWLGQAAAPPIESQIVTETGAGFAAYEKARIAAEQRKAEEAKAEAEKAKASAATAQARREEAVTARAGGVPTSYLILGGVGLALVGVIIAVAS